MKGNIVLLFENTFFILSIFQVQSTQKLKNKNVNGFSLPKILNLANELEVEIYFTSSNLFTQNIVSKKSNMDSRLAWGFDYL